MRHRIAGRKFGRSAAHRQSMTRNQVTSLLRYGRITTTEAKAKELRRWVERVITDAKPDDLNARRKVALYVIDREVSNKLFGDVPRALQGASRRLHACDQAAAAQERRIADGDHRAGRIGTDAVPTYSLTLEYDGTDFAGWQIQPRVRTAMGVLQDAIRTVTGESPALTAAGRTDAGAHAHGQVAGIVLERAWPTGRVASRAQCRAPGRPRGARRRCRGRRLSCASRRGGAQLSLPHRLQGRERAGLATHCMDGSRSARHRRDARCSATACRPA